MSTGLAPVRKFLDLIEEKSSDACRNSYGTTVTSEPAMMYRLFLLYNAYVNFDLRTISSTIS